MKKYLRLLVLLLAVSGTWCGAQNAPSLLKGGAKPDTMGIISTHGPQGITRNIIQDRKGNIWIAAFDGIFRYDGKSFTNITAGVSSARFFSVLEDRKGNFWFGTIGSGVYYYDPKQPEGKRFHHFTKEQGLVDDRVPHIYEDKGGNIWFGTLKGLSRYDGRQFRNYRANWGRLSRAWKQANFRPTTMTMLIRSSRIKAGNFGLAQGGMPAFTMGKYHRSWYITGIRLQTSVRLLKIVRATSG